MNNQMPRTFGRERILTKAERAALGYQSQGSYPGGLKNVRSYTLRDSLKFNATQQEWSLFKVGPGGSTKWDTNVTVGGMIPNGRSLLVHEIVVWLDNPGTAAGSGTSLFTDDAVNAWAAFMRNTVWNFSRSNGDSDAEFLGIELLPAVFGMCNVTAETGEAAPVRIGDFIRPAAVFKLRVPVVLGQNTPFDFTVQLRSALGAANALVTNLEGMTVGLKGLLTKMAAV